MALNFNILTSMLSDYTEDADAEFTDRIPMFIELAEDRLFRDLDTFGFVVHSRTSVSTGDPLISKHSTNAICKGLFWVSTNNVQKPIEKRTDEFCKLYWPDRASVGTKPPKYYAEWDGSTFIFVPTVSNGTLEASWVVRPTVLSTAHVSNWYTENTERALVGATMIEANLFMKNFEQVEMWEKRYAEEIAKLRNETRRQRRDDQQTPLSQGIGENTLDGQA